MLLKNKPKNIKNPRKASTVRRNNSDRRKCLSKVTGILDRRNIEGRRKINDRRVSNKKPQFSLITEQGITVSHLVDQQTLAISHIAGFKNTVESKEYIEVMSTLRDIYFIFYSLLSKERILFEWYAESSKNNKNCDDEIYDLVSSMHFIFCNDLQDMIDLLDQYLSLQVSLDDEVSFFQNDMQEITEVLVECLALKEKYLYPHYKEYLLL